MYRCSVYSLVVPDKRRRFGQITFEDQSLESYRCLIDLNDNIITSNIPLLESPGVHDHIEGFLETTLITADGITFGEERILIVGEDSIALLRG